MTASTKPYGLPELVALLEPLPHDPDEAWGAPAIAGELSAQYGLQLPYHALLPDGLHVRPEKELVGLGVPRAEVAAQRWAPRGTGLPALPLPFDSHDLAAFMLDGWGLNLQEHWELSSLEDGGDHARSLALVPMAREVITQALTLREGVYRQFDLARQPPVCRAGSAEDRAYSEWRAGALVDATLALFAAAPTATQHGDAASSPVPDGADEDEPQEERVIVHTTGSKRTNVLTSVVAKAQTAAGGADANASDVWTALLFLARSATPPAPLTGEVTPGGIKYLYDEGKVKTFTKKDLGDRLRRAKAR